MSVTAMPKTHAAGAAPEPEADAKGGKKKLLVIVLVALLIVGGAGAFLTLRGGGEPAEPVPGEVLTLDPIQVNLAGEHYLRVGVAMQLVEGAHEVDGSKALDATIALFSGMPIAEANDPKARATHKEELLEELSHRYHDEVLEVYFTEFVTQ